jgi:hypothetical protein
MRNTTGILYIGQWENGVQHGKGKKISGVMVCEGQWVMGQMNGHGKSYYKKGYPRQGITYEGPWAGGMPLGAYQRTQEELDKAEAQRDGDGAGR